MNSLKILSVHMRETVNFLHVFHFKNIKIFLLTPFHSERSISCVFLKS